MLTEEIPFVLDQPNMVPSVPGLRRAKGPIRNTEKPHKNSLKIAI